MTTAAAPGISRPHNVRRGVVQAMLAVLAFTVMDSLLKKMASELPVMQVFLFRWVFALPPILLVVSRNGGFRAMRTKRLTAHLWRSALSTISLGGFIYAFGHMKLADVVAISFAAPVLVTVFSGKLLGEHVDRKRWIAVLAGFAGVLVITRPGTGVFGLAAAVALGATLFYAVGLILVRRLGATESTAATSFILAISSIVTGLCFIPFGWVWPSGAQLAWLAVMGTVGGTANMLVTAAYRNAPAATVAPLDYTLLIGTTAIGYFVFNEVPDVWVFVGAAIVVASGLTIIYAGTRRERPA